MHWRTVLRVMVHPKYQGSGAGTALMTGLRRSAEDLGLEQLQLTVRDGSSLEKSTSVSATGSSAGTRAIRVGPDDYRDEIMLVTDLV